MLKRLSDLIRFIKGDYIVLKIVNKNTLVVDAKNFDKVKLKEVASVFLKQVYDL
jgi:hypothetical protein